MAARATAHREFGGIERTKEIYRDRRGLPFVDAVVQDVRYRRQPVHVIGITPSGFFGVILGRSPGLYLPLGAFGIAQPGLVTAENPDYWQVIALRCE